MAEGIVKLILSKLGEAAVKEVLYLYGAGGKLDSLQHELGYIRAFLKDAETRKNSDERVKTWVSDVREAAYRIEDVVDMFMAEVDDGNRPKKINALKVVLKNPMKLLTVRKLIGEMDKIKKTLRAIKELTDKYGINMELGVAGPSSAVLMRRPREIILPDEDDPDVIGLEDDKNNILQLLLDPNVTKRRVVSIIGQGGLGKTTLAKKAYNRLICTCISYDKYMAKLDITPRIISN
ncbi:hypothetical protein LUZ61_011868 [Rhynchospora tenuis]|uniref:Disease resistance protein n=1 Tax=Rhynchospora tenuis TaxID=198213 RepID=A0AAD6F0Z4_9POAL|nr:hypothetical protein LUZ61_011868 [Rhynchospora tenuis]